MKFFTADDFFSSVIMTNQQLADRCNEKLQREARVVYGLKSTKLGDEFYFSEHKDDADTHRALLICVEEIERKPCEHDAQLMNVFPGVVRWECLYCKKTMKPTKWEVVDEQR